ALSRLARGHGGEPRGAAPWHVSVDRDFPPGRRRRFNVARQRARGRGGGAAPFLGAGGRPGLVGGADGRSLDGADPADGALSLDRRGRSADRRGGGGADDLRRQRRNLAPLSVMIGRSTPASPPRSGS